MLFRSSGDVAPALIVYDAEVALTGPNGARRIPLEKMYRNDGMAHLTLQPNEILTSVHLPTKHAGDPSSYEKARIRGSIDFPLAGAAVRLKLAADGTIADIAVALTGVNPYPQRISGTDALKGKMPDESLFDGLRETVRSEEHTSELQSH